MDPVSGKNITEKGMVSVVIDLTGVFFTRTTFSHVYIVFQLMSSLIATLAYNCRQFLPGYQLQ